MRKTALLAAAVLVLAGCDSNKDSDGSAQVHDTDQPASSPTVTSTVIGEFPDGSLQPGRYALQPIGPLDKPLAVVDVPAGYHSWSTFIEADEPAGFEDPLMLGLWRITEVFENPCATSQPVKPKSVRATADAFLQQRFTSSTRPRVVELAGYHGLYLEVTTPRKFDYSACADGEMNLWDGYPDSTYWTRKPGIVSKLWILDIDGQPMVVHLVVPPSATDKQVGAMTGIIEGTVFR